MKHLSKRWTPTLKTVCLWIFVAAIFETTAMGFVPLGPWYGLEIMFIAPLMAVPAVLCLKLLIYRMLRIHLKRKQRLFLRLAVLLFCGIGAFFLLLPFFLPELSKSEDADAALEFFEEARATQKIEWTNLQHTLAELERARYRLEGEWSASRDDLTISLRLYTDIREYRTALDREWSVGLVHCHTIGATIHIPVESPSEMVEPSSNTPLHEMVHAIMCQSLGRSAFLSMPRWFHEGIAELYAGEGLYSIEKRVRNRFRVWLNRQDLLTPDKFCSYRVDGPEDEISLFYATAWEFAISLDGSYGRSVLTELIDLVAAGETFEGGLLDRFGSTCSELYGKWLFSF